MISTTSVIRFKTTSQTGILFVEIILLRNSCLFCILDLLKNFIPLFTYILLILLFILTYWKCYFTMTSHVRQLVGWSVTIMGG